MNKIILTGGGTSGHVTPNLALIPGLIKKGFKISYIGRKEGIEKELLQKTGIEYHSISAGKLRRYFDMKNFTDTGRIIKGFFQCLNIIKTIKPNVIFSKGGFVSTPVVWAAAIKKIPVVIHESDITPGLANKLVLRFADKICCSFPETFKYFNENGKDIQLTGLPVREELFKGSSIKGREMCGFDNSKPVLVVIGGSQGSLFINNLVRNELDRVLKNFQVCHLCGKGGMMDLYNNMKGYKQYEYVTQQLPHIFAMADIFISRAGATTLFEILSLNKPNILIPLSKKASRGDQILNAESFKKQGFSFVVEEDELNDKSIHEISSKVYEEKDKYIQCMKKSNHQKGTQKILDILNEYSK